MFLGSLLSMIFIYMTFLESTNTADGSFIAKLFAAVTCSAPSLSQAAMLLAEEAEPTIMPCPVVRWKI